VSTPNENLSVPDLRAVVDRRRDSGELSADIEDELGAHFRSLTSFRPQPTIDALASIERAARALAAYHVTVDVQLESDVPGGSGVHRATGRVVTPQIDALIEQIDEQRDTLVASLDQFVATAHEVLSALDSFEARREACEDTFARAHARVNAQDEAIYQLQRESRQRTIDLGADHDRFVERMRSGDDVLAEHDGAIADQLVGYDPVLQIGGRHQMLDALTARGIGTVRVEAPDGLGVLRESGGDAFGALVVLGAVEKMPAGDVVELVSLAAHKIRPGGKLLIETLNPLSLSVHSHDLFADPRRLRLVHPELLEYLVESSGFGEWRIEWLSTGAEGRAKPVPGGDAMVDTLNENFARVDRLLFAPRQYLLIGVR